MLKISIWGLDAYLGGISQPTASWQRDWLELKKHQWKENGQGCLKVYKVKKRQCKTLPKST